MKEEYHQLLIGKDSASMGITDEEFIIMDIVSTTGIKYVSSRLARKDTLLPFPERENGKINLYLEAEFVPRVMVNLRKVLNKHGYTIINQLSSTRQREVDAILQEIA